MKKKSEQKGIVILIVAILLICLVIGYYYYLSNRKIAEAQKDNVELTAVQKVLTRDLDHHYPPTPREVVKYFGDLTQCFYGEDYTEEEFLGLAAQIQKLYDGELIANKTQEKYLEDLRLNVDNFKEQNITVTSYSPASSTDVEEFTQDGFSWARIRCSFHIKRGSNREITEEVFILRKDKNGHWKIYGWALAENSDNSQGDEVQIDIGL